MESLCKFVYTVCQLLTLSPYYSVGTAKVTVSPRNSRFSQKTCCALVITPLAWQLASVSFELFIVASPAVLFTHF